MSMHLSQKLNALLSLFVSLFALHLFFCSASFAGNTRYESIEALKLSVQNVVIDELKKNVAQENLRVTVSNLDPRLKLTACSEAKNIRMRSNAQSNAQLTSNVSVGVSCNGDTPWSIFIPVKVEIFQAIVVAKHNIPKGTVITAQDLNVERRSTGGIGFGYTQNIKELVGFESARHISKGDVVRRSHLNKPMIVSRGDKLVLAAGANGIQVAAPAVAMGEGRVGDQIRVKNTQSNRIVDAFVVSRGQVVAKL
ncbi:MAG: flagellar basal body P-ring formation chaperone FlgA [Marinagarivorans sp.]|nr:flagellar basal body P-ring formation chaperone FlgA [Marinagarivorans sp.]